MSERQKGTVKWFNESKGFGFIQLEDERDAFVYYKEIQGSGFRTLSPGQSVSFELHGHKFLVEQMATKRFCLLQHSIWVIEKKCPTHHFIEWSGQV